MTITIERIGRRSYIRGNTYAFKDKLRGAGANWDAEQRCWWISNKDKAEAVVAEINAAGGDREQSSAPEKITDDTVVAGKARYQGREYLLLWDGMTKRGGHAAKLAFRDGSKVFWADYAEVEVVKRYAERRSSGRGVWEPMTFGKLERLRAKYKANGGRPAEGSRYECEECGEWVTRGEGSCWETGASH